ncbi:hypothetical protein BDR06DRAFT_968292 [Suillus hirtellus]|nr:hypothetical protein BDR06DRAFT_968292 [Suillus hirtellus]
MALLRVASIYLWDGFCKVIQYVGNLWPEAPKFHLEVLATLKQDGPTLCQAIWRLAVLAAAALRVMHGSLYWSSLTTQLGLGLWADNNQLKEMGNCLREWVSSFTVLAVMCNRHSLLHQDSQSLAQWFDIMTSIGVMVGTSGRVVRHGVDSVIGDRVSWVCAVLPSRRMLGFVMRAYQFLTYQAWAHPCKGSHSQACGCCHILMYLGPPNSGGVYGSGRVALTAAVLWAPLAAHLSANIWGLSPFSVYCIAAHKFKMAPAHHILGVQGANCPATSGHVFAGWNNHSFLLAAIYFLILRWVGPYHLAEMSRWAGQFTTCLDASKMGLWLEPHVFEADCKSCGKRKPYYMAALEQNIEGQEVSKCKGLTPYILDALVDGGRHLRDDFLKHYSVLQSSSTNSADHNLTSPYLSTSHKGFQILQDNLNNVKAHVQRVHGVGHTPVFVAETVSVDSVLL